MLTLRKLTPPEKPDVYAEGTKDGKEGERKVQKSNLAEFSVPRNEGNQIHRVRGRETVRRSKEKEKAYRESVLKIEAGALG